MLRELPVTDLMVTDVTTFTADQNVQDAMRVLVTEDIDAGPVVDENDHVIGLFSTGDVIVEEARLHLPTIVNFLGRQRGPAVARQGARRVGGQGAGRVRRRRHDRAGHHHRQRRHRRGRRHPDARREGVAPAGRQHHRPPGRASSPAATSSGRSSSASTSPTRRRRCPTTSSPRCSRRGCRVGRADAADEQG